jgi:hypothetical protein
VRRKIARLAEDEAVDPILVVMLVQQFVAAKLDPGEELREFVAASMQDEAAADAAPSDLNASLEQIAQAAGGDLFALQTQLASIVDSLPAEHRAALVVEMTRSSVVLIREAALAWLLDGDREVRHALAGHLAATAPQSGVSPTMLRRMTALREWLPEASRPALDRAIEACRAAGIASAPWPEARRRGAKVSGVDGSGAQSIFVEIEEPRRKNAIASLLVKHGLGIRDAWTNHAMTRREADEFASEIAGNMDVFPVDDAFLRLAAAHFLADNVAQDVPPPFGLLDVAETAGLEGLRPEPMPVERLLEELARALGPGPLEPEEVAELLAAGPLFCEAYDFVDSWFEDGDEVEALLGGAPPSRAERVAAVRDRLLPSRRGHWAATFAWTAAAMRRGDPEEDWHALLIAARELLGGRPLAEIPLMTMIAEATVEAFEERQAGGDDG